MSKSLIVSYDTAAVGDNTTRFMGISGALSNNSTEAQVECPVRFSGTFSKFFTYASANTTTTVSSVFTIRKSRADTSITVTYAAGETGIKEDTSNSDSFAATDEIDTKVAVADYPLASQTITITLIGIQFEPTNCVSLMLCSGGFTFATASATRYVTPNCLFQGSTTSTEANANYRIRSSFTSSNFNVYVNSNSRTTNTVFGTRVNGGNGSETVTYTSTQTGEKEDTSNTDSLVAGDDFNYYFTTGTGVQNIQPQKVSSNFLNTSSIFCLLAGKATGVAVNFNTTTYMASSGNLNTTTTTEANTQIYPQFEFTAKELVSYVSANTIATTASTITVRDNGADSSVTVSYAAAETGLKNDTSNTATITSGSDEINYKIATPNTSGSLTITYIGVLGETSGGPSTVSTVVQAIMF